MNAFCAPENFDAFIVFRSFPNRKITTENASSERFSFLGSDHDQPHLPVSVVLEVAEHILQTGQHLHPLIDLVAKHDDKIGKQ
jgi:hypothetical protein